MEKRRMIMKNVKN
jgi:hypothetical protein